MNEINKDIQKTPEQTLFNPQSNDFFIFKKTEKITSAVHYITNLFPEKEPLRLSLRKHSLELISFSMSFIKQSNLSSLITELSTKLVEIKSLLKVAVFSNLFNEKNYEIMALELDQLLALLENKKVSAFSLPSSFLDMPISQIKEEVRLPDIKDIYIKDTQKDTLSTKQTSPVYQGVKRQGSPYQQEKSIKGDLSREERIFGVLRTSSNITIRDISLHFKDCGEKTIQRELLRLVAEGKVLKRGERRWSRYSLI